MNVWVVYYTPSHYHRELSRKSSHIQAEKITLQCSPLTRGEWQVMTWQFDPTRIEPPMGLSDQLQLSQFVIIMNQLIHFWELMSSDDPGYELANLMYDTAVPNFRIADPDFSFLQTRVSRVITHRWLWYIFARFMVFDNSAKTILRKVHLQLDYSPGILIHSYWCEFMIVRNGEVIKVVQALVHTERCGNLFKVRSIQSGEQVGKDLQCLM